MKSRTSSTAAAAMVAIWLLSGCFPTSLPAVYYTDQSELEDILDHVLSGLNDALGCKAFISGRDEFVSNIRIVRVTFGELNSITSIGQYYQDAITLAPDMVSSLRFQVLLHEIGHSAGLQHVKGTGKLMSKSASFEAAARPEAELFGEFVDLLGDRTPCRKGIPPMHVENR